jgi:hypothetical protein
MKLSEYRGSEARHILVYGAPKTGKTELVGALAEHFTLWWFDLDGGAKTLMGTTSKAYKHLDNINYFRIPDTQTFPIALETMLKVIKGGAISVCQEHGKVNCPACKAAGKPATEIDVSKFDNKKDILVIDSYTQLMDSVINWIHKDALGKDDWGNLKSTYDDWAKQGSISDRFGSTFQNAPYNSIVISHELLVELEDGSKKIAPIGGTRNKSSDFAKYFDDVVYTEVVGGAFKAWAHQADKSRVVLGSRTGKKLQDAKGIQLGLRELFL